MKLLRWSIVLAVALSGGCLQSALSECGDVLCPVGTVCTPGGCALQSDVMVCAGLADGATCHASNGGAGTCQGGACHTGLCGNGVLDVGEICDDGNQVSGDGCRADCAKMEICGDGVVDQGEACDDGNHNAADGCDTCKLTGWDVTVLVGGEVAATMSALANPSGIAIDGLGRMYLADTDNHRIQRVELDGSVTTIAGTGTVGFGGDGGPATSAFLASPNAVAVDGVGRVFIADTANQRVRRIEIDGIITTIVGTGTPTYGGDDGPAILAAVANPHGIAVDGLGHVLIADTDNHRIRQVDVDGTITTVAGTGTSGYDGDNKPAITAELASPYSVAIDNLGRILIADTANQRIRRVALDGKISTIAGTGNASFGGDNGPAIAADLAFPTSVAVDAMGRLAITDTINQRIRRVDAAGTITTLGGIGTAGYNGDGGQATAAAVNGPLGVAFDLMGRPVIVDNGNQRIRRVELDGKIATVAGNGTYGFGGDGGPATSAQLANPYGVAVDATGRIFVADTFNHRIRRVDADGTITTVAGTGIPGFSGDGGPANAAQLQAPAYVSIDPMGRPVFADTQNQRIRRVELDGTITTVGGDGNNSYGGDNGPAINAQLSNPNGVTVDTAGNIYVADTYNQRIRKIDNTTGKITTVAGNGSFGFSGDGVPAITAPVEFPYGVAVDTMGRVVFSDTGNQRVRRVELDGTIATIAGTGISGFNGDGILATTAKLASPYGVHVDAMGRVLILDNINARLRRIELDGKISTLSGTGTLGASGDAALASAAQLSNPLDATVDALGQIILTDTNNERIRRIAVDGTITTVAGKIDPDGTGPVAKAHLDDPQAISVAPNLTLIAGGTSGTLEAVVNGRVEVVGGRYPQALATGNLARFRTDAFGTVGGVAYDAASSSIYMSETSSNRLQVITIVDPAHPDTWTIAALANAGGTAGFADGAAATALFRAPGGLFLDGHTLYIADTGNHAIRALDLQSHVVSTVVNTGHSLGFGGDDGPATAALLYQPTAVTRCPDGDLFIADTGNNRIRRVVPTTGIITTVLGDGIPASSGEGQPARTFPVDGARGLACDTFGNLFVTSSTTVRLLPASDMGVVDGSGSVHTIYGAPPRTTFPTTVTNCLTGLSVTSDTTIAIADACTGLLIELTRTAR